jgi:predicted MPP superfamily phosphohydrolase
MWRFIIFLAILGLAEYYSFIVVRSAVRTLPSAWRISLTVLYLALTAMAWLGFFLFRRIDWAHVPHLLRNIYIAFVFGFSVGKILILLLMLIDEVRRLVLWIANLFYTGGTSVETDNTQSGITRSTFISRMALLVGGFALGGFLYGITNRYKYQVKRIRLSLKSLPDAFKGLKIVQISDIHSGSFDNHEAVKKGIQIVLDERPDIIFFTGDLVNNRADEVDTYKEIFSQLKAPMGVYSTLGNHDYGDYVDWPSAEAKHENLERLKALHGEMGWRLLMNEHIVFDRGDQSIAVIGIENWGNKANFPKYGDMKKATEGLAAKNVPVKILLSHDPSHWDAQVRPEYGDIQLTLSGHTHGMQFGVEIPWLKWSPIKYMYKEWAGLYQEGEQYLYVNRGFGFLGYPGRLGILPEITVIELA